VLAGFPIKLMEINIVKFNQFVELI
jgi:hypothetical protein